MNLDEIIALLDSDPDLERELSQFISPDSIEEVWVPNPGPQTMAYFSQADELFYGGSAGGGKSDLLLGLALNCHQQSLVLRRTNREVNGLVERLTGIIGTRDGYNSQTGLWRYKDRTVEIGGCQLEEDKQKYKGRAKSLYCFDEISDFSEAQYRFITTWNRSATPGERCRIVGAGNPPTRPEGLWVMRHWRAWLDPTYPKPARPGELRWYTTDHKGEEVEVDGPGPHYLNGSTRPLLARSRTFIPAKLSDNPDLIDSGYQASLDALPAELRAAYRDGDFGTPIKDDAYQIIPTAWVKEAQSRWSPQPPIGIPMCAMGVDIAIAKDKFVIASRHDWYYPELIAIPGRDIADPKQAAGRVLAARRDNATVIVDVGGGWGADCYAQLAANGLEPIGYMGVKTTRHKSSDGRFEFANIRTEALWKFREALDPSQPGGSLIALPPDPEITADLCAPTYKLKGTSVGGVLQAESKEDVCHRLGRSPDKGDAVIMAWFRGLKQYNIKEGWSGRDARRIPVVNRGSRHAR